MKFSLALSALLIQAVTVTVAHAQLFQVAKPQFSASVSDDSNYTVIGPAVNGQIARSALSQGRLFLSFEILALKPAIDYLQQNDKLAAHVVVVGGWGTLATIDCGITEQRWFEIGEKLLGTFNSDGDFRFRTFMYTQQTTYDALTFIVHDDFGAEIARAQIKITP